MACSQFYWDLPLSIDQSFLENVLFRHGSICIFREDVLNELVAMRFTLAGQLSIYNTPLAVRAYSPNTHYTSIHLKPDERVLIYDNNLRISLFPFCQMFAALLADIDAAINVNVNAQKTPIIIACDENQRLTMENFMMKYNGNLPEIMTKKGFDPKKISVLNLNAPFVADKLETLKKEIWNDALSFLGIDNNPMQKKERVREEEIVGAMGGTESSRAARLLPRIQACKEINKIFGDFLEEPVKVSPISNLGGDYYDSLYNALADDM